MRSVLRPAFHDLRLNQLDRALEPFRVAQKVPVPPGVGSGPSVKLPASLRVNSPRPPAPAASSVATGKAEADDSITLKSLRKLAGALDCDLVYALVPREGTMQGALKRRARAEATRRVLAVDIPSALEDQASGGLEAAIDAETQRLLQQRRQP